MRKSNTKTLKNNKLSKTIRIIIIICVSLFIIKEITNRYSTLQKPVSKSLSENNNEVITAIKSPPPFIVKDLSNRFIFTFPPSSFGDYHGSIETTVMGRHGHDYDQKYRLVQDVLIIGGSIQNPIEVELKNPFEVKTTFDPNYSKHIDLSKLVILYTHDSTGSNRYPWITLPTTVDLQSHTARATGTQLGNYVLVGPLICPKDSKEFDDNYDSSKTISQNDFGKPMNMIFDVPGDENWLNFIAHKNKSYKLETVNLADNVKPLIDIYDNGGVDKLLTLATNGEWTPPLEQFKFSSDVNFFISVRADHTSSIGCTAKFNFKLTEI